MTKEFRKLNELEKTKRITVGLDREQANNYWYQTTKVGKPLNLLTLGLIVTTIYLFFRSGFKLGISALIITGFYSVAIQKLAGWHVRSQLLKKESLFDTAYKMRSVTIRNNGDGEIIYTPTDWREWLKGI